MTTNLANKTSIKVPFQLPEFIRSEDNYHTFIAFIQAYYEWMEEQNIGSGKEGVIYGTQNLLNYQDVDFSESGETFNKFIDYYINDFLPNFPKDVLTDKSKMVKIARRLYETKGTPASYQFLFRALYNSDADIFLTRDVVLKASDGKWYVSKSLRLATNDEQFLSIENLRVFGKISKSIATVERAIQVGNRIELYITNIERLFQSGEDIIVVNNNNRPLYFKDSLIVDPSIVGSTTLEAKILGSISSVSVNSKKRGQLYVGRSPTYSGDPVVFYGGLRNDTASPIGATAYVYETTSGSLRDIILLDGSYGYREDPNTYIQIRGGGGAGAIANVSSVDPAGLINVAFIPKDYLSSAVRNTTIGNSKYSFFSANANSNAVCTLANAFSFTSFSTYPIASVILNNGGGGYTSLPTVSAKSLYDTTDTQTTESLKIKGELASLGILGPIQIVTQGVGYANGDIITFTDSAGNGANANVSVNSTGSIIYTSYKYANTSSTIKYPLGGMGYKSDRLPTLRVISANGVGASLRVNTVLGAGALFTPVSDERGIGAITSFLIENYGEDYISAPSVSLRVRDLVVTNVSLADIVQTGEFIYQGSNVNSAVFKAYVDSISLLEIGANTTSSKYLLRTYNYTSNTKTNLQLNITDRNVGANIHLDLDTTYTTSNTATGEYIFKNGIRTYGNGAAQATAKFLNGLIIGQGQYINDDGFLSSNQVLENEEYNNFTYQLVVQKSFDAYKDILNKLLHPSGTKIVPVNALKSQENIVLHRESFESNSSTLAHYTGSAGSNATIYSTFTNPSNNIIKFDSLAGANLSAIMNVGSILSLTQDYGPNVYSEVISVNSSSNTAVIKDNVFLSFANVVTANVMSSNNRINILGLTGQYDIINNGEYSNIANPVRDIVFIGDRIRVVSGSNEFNGTVSYISYSNNVIFANTTLSFTSNTANVSIGRTLSTVHVDIYNTLGTVFYPELLTQDNRSITTQDGSILILG